MGVVNLDFWTGLVPSAGILYMPTYYKNLKYFYAVRDYVTPILDKDMQKKANVKILGWYEYDQESLISQKNILKPEEFKGTKLPWNGSYAATLRPEARRFAVVTVPAPTNDAPVQGGQKSTHD